MHKHSYFRFILLLLIAFIWQSCSRVKTTYYSNGKVESELTYKSDKLNGTASWYYNTGALKQQVEYKNDKMEGKMITYFANGEKETEVLYKNNLKNGNAIKWDRFGTKLEEVNYKNDTLHGAITTWFDKEALCMTGSYKNGLYDGKWIYYDELGLILGEGNYKDGNGILVSFDRLGRKKREVSYQKNEKNGPEKWFFDDGQLEKVVMYKNGKAIEMSDSKALETEEKQK